MLKPVIDIRLAEIIWTRSGLRSFGDATTRVALKTMATMLSLQSSLIGVINAVEHGRRDPLVEFTRTTRRLGVSMDIGNAIVPIVKVTRNRAVIGTCDADVVV